jgi:signal transduction histidine kinase
MERITDGTDKMVRLINELIALMMVGRIAHEPMELSLRALVDEAVGLLQDQITTNNIALHIVDDLPNVHGDHQQLLEVFQNLIENAIKFMGEQTQPRIEIGMKCEDSGMPLFFVRDNGIGLEPRFTERIFGIFHKLDARSEGTGIGLALVKRIIEVHGGRIWAESDGLLQGSTFCFTLPVDGNNRTTP